MSIGLYTGASHLNALEQWQAMAAHNLANSSMPGFQGGVFAIKGSEVGDGKRIKAAAPDAYQLNGSIQRSLAGGEIQVTNNPNDLAIQGEGFFSLQGENGATYYTRNGEFHRNNEGVLVNATGYPLLADGSPIQLTAEDGPLSVAEDGTVSQDGQQVGRVSVYRFENADALRLERGSLISDPLNLAGPTLIETPTIGQGQLEMSNVSPMREMISMIEIARAYDISQKALQQQDERVEKAIQAFSL
jgi:flagellar basal-body rod protein FlgF